MICGDKICGCAIETSTLFLSGSGTPEDPWVIEQIEFADLATIQSDIAGILATLDTLPNDYVPVVGGTMYGALAISPTADLGLSLRSSSNNPYMEWRSADGATRYGYIQAAKAFSSQFIINAEDSQDIRVIAGSSDRFYIIASTGIVLVGKVATNLAAQGLEFQPGGYMSITRSGAASPNIDLNKTGAADANGQAHIWFRSAGTTIGSITRATSTTVAYNTSSDEEIKQHIRSMPDELVLWLLRVVEPLFFEYIAQPDVVHGGYIAQRVAALWPESLQYGVVTPGQGDIANRHWDADGNELTTPEEWSSWMIDVSKMVPFLHAGWRINDRAISSLNVEVAELREDLAALQAVVITLSEKNA